MTLGGDGPNVRDAEDGAAAAVGSRRPPAAAAAAGGGGNDSGSPEPRLGRQQQPAGAPQQPTATARARGGEDETASDNFVAKVGDYVQEAFRFGAGVASSGELWGKSRDEDAAEWREEGEQEEEEHQMKVMFREQLPMPFELAMLEVMLQEVSETVSRGNGSKQQQQYLQQHRIC